MVSREEKFTAHQASGIMVERDWQEFMQDSKLDLLKSRRKLILFSIALVVIATAGVYAFVANYVWIAILCAILTLLLASLIAFGIYLYIPWKRSVERNEKKSIFIERSIDDFEDD